MPRQYWGILAPNDHRKPLFRTSLLLFDQLVVPDSPLISNDLSAQEIDQFCADIDYLSGQGAVQQFHWNQQEFENWCRKSSGSSGDEVLQRWPNCATRYYLQHQCSGLLADDRSPVAAFPLYLNPKFFDIISLTPEDSRGDGRLILEVIFPNFPTPSEETSLEEILFRRREKSFEASLQKMRSWQLDVLPELADDPRDHAIRMAAKEFEGYVTDYENAVREINVARRNTIVTWAFKVGMSLEPKIPTVVKALLGMWNPRLLSMRKVFTPNWKLLLDKPFAPAGVIHEASQLSLRRPKIDSRQARTSRTR